MKIENIIIGIFIIILAIISFIFFGPLKNRELKQEQDKLEKIENQNNINNNSIPESTNEPIKNEADIEKIKKSIADAKNKLVSEYDSVEDITWLKGTSANRLTQNTFYLYTQDKNSYYIPRLVISYYGEDWLFIDKYIFNVDGEKYVIIPQKVDTHIGYAGKVAEWSDESLTEETALIIEKIINSKSTTLRYSGRSFYKDKTISQSEKTALKNVLDYYKLINDSKSLSESIKDAKDWADVWN